MAGETSGNGSTKKEREVEIVLMSDGRKVEFVGKRKVLKSTLIDETKIQVDGSIIQLETGAVAIRMDYRNGETRTYPLQLGLIPKYAGHGGEQKFGDELASPADKPMSEDDMVIATDDLFHQLETVGWRAKAEGGGGVSGASLVVRAIMEVSGKDLQTVKNFLQGKLDGDKDLTRRALYDSFRAPGTKTAAIIQRMEQEKLSKTAKVDADAALAEMAAA